MGEIFFLKSNGYPLLGAGERDSMHSTSQSQRTGALDCLSCSADIRGKKNDVYCLPGKETLVIASDVKVTT